MSSHSCACAEWTAGQIMLHAKAAAVTVCLIEVTLIWSDDCDMVIG
jgi:hypothetical protein